MATEKKKAPSAWKTAEPFVLGGLSGIVATTIIQPIDMIKVRIQLLDAKSTGSRSPLALGMQVIKQDGVLGLYKGLSAAWLRQATYTTARMGIFQVISDAFVAQNKGQPIPFWQKTVAGLAAGGLGAMVGTPADVSLIRMQADGTLPPDQRRNYKGVGNALFRITKEEGINGLFKGNLPVVVRAMALNVGMLSTNDQAQESLKPYLKDNPALLSFTAKLISGFFASAFSLPFDFVKTRMQKQKPNADGTYPYRGLVQCFGKVAKEEGLGTFYRGFGTYYVRIAPHAMITLWALDHLKAWSKKLDL